ncbi:MAG: hypothetical protein Q9166_004828 [cf. Caloplaca sp. 2 TL-2023]
MVGNLPSRFFTEYKGPTIPPLLIYERQILHIYQQPSTPTMGTWGYNLYQSDVDLNMLDLIADEAAKMMSDPECLRSALIPDAYTLRAPIDKAATVQQLEDGILHRLIRRFNHQKNQGAITILGVVCMELGVKINPEDMLAIKMALMRCEMFEMKRDCIGQALQEYSNDGTVWKYNGKKLQKTATGTDGPDGKKLQETANELEGVKETLPKDMTVKREQEDEDAITPFNAPFRSHSESAINAKYNAQLAELEKILKNSEIQPALRQRNELPNHQPAPAPAQESSGEGRVTFWLPASKSQLDVSEQGDKQTKRKPGESMFTIPVRGSSKAANEDMLEHAESIYRLPPPKPIGKGKGKEVKWKEVIGKENKKESKKKH